jgi:hypothetical protein
LLLLLGGSVANVDYGVDYPFIHCVPILFLFELGVVFLQHFGELLNCLVGFGHREQAHASAALDILPVVLEDAERIGLFLFLALLRTPQKNVEDNSQHVLAEEVG